jgi:dethiobiotin synthase
MKTIAGRGVFVTGTDTDIGKTYVSRLLVDAFACRLTVAYMKPVQTGCIRDASGLLTAPDFDYIMKGRAVMGAEMDDHVPYRLEPACSPHLAASRAGVMISLEYIREKFLRVSHNRSVTVVEGAGGVMTPLSETTSMIDLMLHLQLPVILVTTPRVGTINHTFLTLEALERRSLTPAGIVINNRHGAAENFIYHDNCRILRCRVPSAAFVETGFESECSDSVKEFCDEIIRRL